MTHAKSQPFRKDNGQYDLQGKWERLCVCGTH